MTVPMRANQRTSTHVASFERTHCNQTQVSPNCGKRFRKTTTNRYDTRGQPHSCCGCLRTKNHVETFAFLREHRSFYHRCDPCYPFTTSDRFVSGESGRKTQSNWRRWRTSLVNTTCMLICGCTAKQHDHTARWAARRPNEGVTAFVNVYGDLNTLLRHRCGTCAIHKCVCCTLRGFSCSVAQVDHGICASAGAYLLR